jgi:hypothetical protein
MIMDTNRVIAGVAVLALTDTLTPVGTARTASANQDRRLDIGNRSTPFR